MSVELPVCSAEWVERVEKNHLRTETAHAETADIGLEQYRSEAAQRLRDLLSDRRLQLRMRLDGLEGFMEEGHFRTMFDGGKPSGERSRQKRLEAESIVLGVDPDALAESRPIYGYLQGADETGSSLEIYGTARLILEAHVLERTTVVLGDSLGSTAWGDAPVFAPEPLTTAALLCSFAEVDDLRLSKDLVEVVDPRYRYAELQIYGGLQPRDVAFVTFSQNQLPEAPTLASLKQADIGWQVVPGYPA